MSFALANLVAPLRRFDLPPLASLVNIKALEKLDALLEERAQGLSGSAMENRLEQMRVQLRAVAPTTGAVFNAAFVGAVELFFGHRRLLLQLYLLDEGVAPVIDRLAHLRDRLKLESLDHGRSSTRDYLPPLDRKVFKYLFGSKDSLTWMDGIRAARLFFAHFRHLPAFVELGQTAEDVLVHNGAALPATGKTRQWQAAGAWLFKVEGPQRFSEALLPGETLAAGAARIGVPCPSNFYSAAQQYHLFSRLQRMPIGGNDTALFHEIKESAGTRFEGETTIGVKALQILIRRSIKENHSDLPGVWGSRISEFATDPRLPRRTKEFSIWWSWAGDKELKVALAWFTGRDLDAFIKVLDGSLEGEAKRMFDRRRDFLLKLFKAGKILRARLVLVSSTYRDVMRSLKKNQDFSVLQMNRLNGTSVICIQCDGFSFVEGTHSYAIQLHHEIPVEDFWEGYGVTSNGRGVSLTESTFRQGRVDSVSHVDNRSMRWEEIFKKTINQHFHVYWGDVEF
jgi:EH_Signature domain